MRFPEFFRTLAQLIAVLTAVYACVLAAFWIIDRLVPSCYHSTMGNPDQVVELHGTVFACTNELHGYRCVKMEACEP